MESGKNPGDEDGQQKSKSPQSKEQPKTLTSFMVKIPTEYLTERQKKLLCQKPLSKDEPSTSSEKKEDVFKVPWVPPLKKTEASPTKASSDMASASSSTDMVQDAPSEESVGPETAGDVSTDEKAKTESEDQTI